MTSTIVRYERAGGRVEVKTFHDITEYDFSDNGLLISWLEDETTVYVPLSRVFEIRHTTGG